MNVKTVNGAALTHRIIQKVFHRSYSFYTAGLRMYFVLIPMFSWMLSPWALLAVVPLNLWIVYDYDNISWVEKDIQAMYQEEEEKEKDQEINMKKSLLSK
jgi:uncharacterized membrane protein